MSITAQAAVAGGSQLPVFVFPSAVHFFVDDASSHKQLITLYNPYDFAISYKVLGTAPDKYSVVEAEGTLKQRCCIDVVIRHLATGLRSNVGHEDKFRVQISRYDDRELHGRKDITACLYSTRTDVDPVVDGAQFSGLLPSSSAVFKSRSSQSNVLQSGKSGQQQQQHAAQQQQYPFPHNAAHNPTGDARASNVSTTWLAILVGLACVLALSLPTDLTSTITSPTSSSITPPETTQTSSSTSLIQHLPSWLHLSLTQKLTAAYVLGLVTVLLVRP